MKIKELPLDFLWRFSKYWLNSQKAVNYVGTETGILCERYGLLRQPADRRKLGVMPDMDSVVAEGGWAHWYSSPEVLQYQ